MKDYLHNNNLVADRGPWNCILSAFSIHRGRMSRSTVT